jgi:hypothetical protein
MTKDPGIKLVNLFTTCTRGQRDEGERRVSRTLTHRHFYAGSEHRITEFEQPTQVRRLRLTLR